MKTLAFSMALVIMAIGTLGLLAPSVLVWIPQIFVTSGPFYIIAAIRVAFGLLLISVASVSRAPKALRVVGYILLIAGTTTALTGALAIDRARAGVEWWSQQGPGVLRLTGVLVLAFGGFIAYACGPARRAT